jgi:hypothetical protein
MSESNASDDLCPCPLLPRQTPLSSPGLRTAAVAGLALVALSDLFASSPESGCVR